MKKIEGEGRSEHSLYQMLLKAENSEQAIRFSSVVTEVLGESSWLEWWR